MSVVSHHRFRAARTAGPGCIRRIDRQLRCLSELQFASFCLTPNVLEELSTGASQRHAAGANIRRSSLVFWSTAFARSASCAVIEVTCYFSGRAACTRAAVGSAASQPTIGCATAGARLRGVRQALRIADVDPAAAASISAPTAEPAGQPHGAD